MVYINKVINEDLKEIYKEVCCKKFKKKVILITGANGMLASYLIYFFQYLNLEKNYDIKIIGLVRNKEKAALKYKSIMNENLSFIEQNVIEPLETSDKIDYIFHLASSANPKTILNNPVEIIEANVIGTLNMCYLAKSKGSKLIFSSTREVYGYFDELKENLTEDQIGKLNWLEKRACYPESKRMAETLLSSFSQEHGIVYNIIRISHCYGPGMNINEDGRVMSDFISDAVNNRNIVLKSLGNDMRSFCYISDAIVGILLIALKGEKNEIYNLANENQEIKVKDLACLIKESSKNKLEIKYEIGKDKTAYTNYKRIKLNVSKLEDLNWKIKVDLKKGLQKTLENFEIVH